MGINNYIVNFVLNGYLENSSKRQLLSHITTSYDVQTSNGPVVNKSKHYQCVKSSVLEFSK